MGTRTQYRRLLDLLPRQPFGLSALAQDLNRLLTDLQQGPPPLTIKNRRFEWGKRTYIMGIINITPDSFSGDGLLGAGTFTDQSLASSGSVYGSRRRLLDIGGNQPGRVLLRSA